MADELDQAAPNPAADCDVKHACTNNGRPELCHICQWSRQERLKREAQAKPCNVVSVHFGPCTREYGHLLPHHWTEPRER